MGLAMNSTIADNVRPGKYATTRTVRIQTHRDSRTQGKPELRIVGDVTVEVATNEVFIPDDLYDLYEAWVETQPEDVTNLCAHTDLIDEITEEINREALKVAREQGAGATARAFEI